MEGVGGLASRDDGRRHVPALEHWRRELEGGRCERGDGWGGKVRKGDYRVASE